MQHRLLKKIKETAGFTMIELLIVISILGILAVAVLSAINPIEQINRGRDTGSRSDAEQLIGAIDRFYALLGYYPWQTAPNDELEALDFRVVTDEDTDVGGTAFDGSNYPQAAANPTGWWVGRGDDDIDAPGCGVLEVLAVGNSDDDNLSGANCPGSQEIKESFIERIAASDYNDLWIYNSGEDGDTTYVCFDPQSAAFDTEASERCEQLEGTTTGFPWDEACDTSGDGAFTTADDEPFICLP